MPKILKKTREEKEEDKVEEEVKKVEETFDPSLPESKQRHLR